MLEKRQRQREMCLPYTPINHLELFLVEPNFELSATCKKVELETAPKILRQL
ncbi:hypothetical protein HYC85_003883 [Camellia sinensis]|uniref:Uncharacterized protein n=1 Tax=Camellia sinensis TaxID=4442 RepID=A0A7J7HXL3_CAMSI|nr:hypothetical protein HYC85_003883 [Camellia sinensis]